MGLCSAPSARADDEHPYCAIDGAVGGFVLVNADQPGVGLNDRNGVQPVGNNNCKTLGAQRIFVVQSVFETLGKRLVIKVPVRVDVSFAPLTCKARSGMLAQAMPAVYLANGDAPLQEIAYPVALFNQFSGQDELQNLDDVVMSVNGSVGTRGCLESTFWDHGADGRERGGLDLFTTFMHELGHGLGFASRRETETVRGHHQPTGKFLGGFPAVFDTMVYDPEIKKMWTGMKPEELQASAIGQTLYWTGPRVFEEAHHLSAGRDEAGVRLYAPTAFSAGSSIAHFDESLKPDDIMEPFHSGADTSAGLLAPILEDMGWTASICGDGLITGTEDCESGPCCSAECTFIPTGTTCGSTCEPGICTSVGECAVAPAPEGLPCGETTAGPCDLPDECDGNGSCDSRVSPAGVSCGDGTETACDQPDVCDDDGVCQPNFRPDGTDCQDDLYCNGVEACRRGVCESAGPVVCTGGALCMASTCVEGRGCVEGPIAGCCLVDEECDDADDETIDLCPEAGGGCVHQRAPLSCQVDEECSSGGACFEPRCREGLCGTEAIEGCCVTTTECEPLECRSAADCLAPSTCVLPRCIDGSCLYEGLPDCCKEDVECHDTNPCTLDVCDDATCRFVSLDYCPGEGPDLSLSQATASQKAQGIGDAGVGAMPAAEAGTQCLCARTPSQDPSIFLSIFVGLLGLGRRRSRK